jgi:hypothetical protein
MALKFKQIIIQEEIVKPHFTIPKRMIVQYADDDTGQDDQQTINYDDLTAEEKTTLDAFRVLAESKMV